MGPFGDDEEDAELVGDVVDGQVIGRTDPAPPPPEPELPPGVGVVSGARPGVVVLKIDPNFQQQGQGAPAQPQFTDITSEFLDVAMSERSRAVALFLEVPFLAFVALNRDMPGLVRLGAAALGVVRVLEVTQRQAEFEQYLQEL